MRRLLELERVKEEEEDEDEREGKGRDGGKGIEEIVRVLVSVCMRVCLCALCRLFAG